MIVNAYNRTISGDTEVAAPCRSPLLKHYMRSIFPGRLQKTQNRSFSRPSGWRLHCGGRRLTTTEEEETIIINRSGRSTYPEGKSVRRSGATPVLLIPCDANQGDTVDCGDGGEGTAAARQNKTLPITINAVSNRASLTPSEVLAPWRAQWAHRYQIAGREASRD